MSIPEAPSCRVKESFDFYQDWFCLNENVVSAAGLGGTVVNHPPVRILLGSPVVPKVPHPILHSPQKEPHASHTTPPPPPHPPAPTVTITEIEAEPGCRSFSTKTCHKIPIVVPKKVNSELPRIPCKIATMQNCKIAKLHIVALLHALQCMDL